MRVRTCVDGPRRLGIGTTLLERFDEMNKIIYRVMRHELGWAFELNGTRSTGFRTRELARNAAKAAASQHTASARRPTAYETVMRQDDCG
jgi:hypothetical protein